MPLIAYVAALGGAAGRLVLMAVQGVDNDEIGLRRTPALRPG
jgi:hypothetical protein